MDSKVYIVILNWNGWEDTIECLESVFRLQYHNFKVIVCDNFSKDHSMEQIESWAKGEISLREKENNITSKYMFPPISKPLRYIRYNRREAEEGGDFSIEEPELILVQTEANLGFAGGNNVGIRYAIQRNNFGYIWLLNNDTVVDDKALSCLVYDCKTNINVGLCGSTLYYYHFPNKIQAVSGVYNKYLGISKYNLDINNRKEIQYVVGASMLLTKEFIEEIGVLSEEYFLYYEEMDLVMRSKEKFSQMYSASSIVYHKEGATIGGKNNPLEKSEMADFYAIKNRILFTKKYFLKFLVTVYLGLIYTMLNRIRRKQYKRVKMILDILLNNESDYFSYIEKKK